MKAFPNEGFNGWGSPEEGMDLRDYFAAKATDADIREFLWGEVRSNGYISARSQIRTREEAKFAYADAMMKAREAK